MKNGNLYQLAALLMTLVLLSAISFAQSDKKEIKKKKTMMITMTVDEDGETTKIDTIVFGMPDVDIDEIMKDIDIQMDINEDRLKEIHMKVDAEMEEFGKTFEFEMEDHSKELEKAMEELKNELKNLDMEEAVQERIQKAMIKLEEAGKLSRTHMNRFIIDEDHPVFFGNDGKYEVIVDEDGENVETKVIWLEKDGHADKNKAKEIKVWVDSVGEEKVIVKSDGAVSGDFFINGDDEENIIIDLENADMAMFSSAKDKDIDKAIAAGLPVDKDNMMEEMNVFIEVKDGEAPIIKLNTVSKGKMKATAYDDNFKKIKKLKLTKEDDKSVLNLDTDFLKDSEVKYIFLEQDGKTDLMRIM